MHICWYVYAYGYINVCLGVHMYVYAHILLKYFFFHTKSKYLILNQYASKFHNF